MPATRGAMSFNTLEASRVLSERWQDTLRKCQDGSLSDEERPVAYRALSSGSVWGKSTLHLQPSVTDFVAEVRAAVAASSPRSNGSQASSTPPRSPSQ